MLLTETRGKEQEGEEKPEEFFARYILSRAFENEQDSLGSTVLTIGLAGPNTAYELARLKAADAGDDLFMVRVASYPSRGIDDWMRTAVFSAQHEAYTYIHYLKSTVARAKRV